MTEAWAIKDSQGKIIDVGLDEADLKRQWHPSYTCVAVTVIEKGEAYEAIAALRSEPVAWTAHGIKREDTCVWVQDSDGPWNTSCGKVFEFTNEGPAENEANFCYHCGGALLPEPYSDAAPSRETDQRENSNPAPVHGQSKTGLTGSHPGAPTKDADELPVHVADALIHQIKSGASFDRSVMLIALGQLRAHLSRKEPK